MNKEDYYNDLINELVINKLDKIKQNSIDNDSLSLILLMLIEKLNRIDDSLQDINDSIKDLKDTLYDLF